MPPRALRFALPGAIACLGVALASAPRPSTPSALESDPSGWADLLEDAGPDLKGWTRLPVKASDRLKAESQWSLDPASKVLTCAGDGGHDWLRWDREQGDFIYHVEWRFTPVAAGKKSYNSGIYVRNSADAKVWHQAQVGGGPEAYLFGETLLDGSLKRINLAKEQADKRVRPAGGWNTFEVTCKGRDVSLWVNGQSTVEWHDCPVPRGYVGLEAEGYRIEFRDVKLKPL